MPATYIYDFSYDSLTAQLAEWGYSVYHVDKLWHYLYRQQVTQWSEMGELRADLLTQLKTDTRLAPLTTQYVAQSEDTYTQKYLLNLIDQQSIETVLMRYEVGENGRNQSRATACISTQVGCALGCVFCATGQMGFLRHLTAGEIVAQILHLTRTLSADDMTLRNIVLMGMGEPLHNYDATMTAIGILTHDKGLAIAPRHITLSTVGLVPGIRRLAHEQIPINLAVSLHGATDEERSKLAPVNKRWPLAELMAACRYYITHRQRRIFFEWTLIEGKNDTSEQAHALGQLLQGMSAHVNLIPLNPTHSYQGKPTQITAVRQFQAILKSYDLPSTVRQRRGIDIHAGCGQLRSSHPPTSINS